MYLKVIRNMFYEKIVTNNLYLIILKYSHTDVTTVPFRYLLYNKEYYSRTQNFSM